MEQSPEETRVGPQLRKRADREPAVSHFAKTLFTLLPRSSLRMGKKVPFLPPSRSLVLSPLFPTCFEDSSPEGHMIAALRPAVSRKVKVDPPDEHVDVKGHAAVGPFVRMPSGSVCSARSVPPFLVRVTAIRGSIGSRMMNMIGR